MSRHPPYPPALISLSAWSLLLAGPALNGVPALGQGPRVVPQVIGGGDLDPLADPPAGTDISQVIGAASLYQAGYTGSRAVVASIEDNFVWTGHETLAHVNTFLYAVGRVPPEAASHPTSVSSLIGGRSTPDGGIHQQGVAPGAALWSGAFGLGFDLTLVTPYYLAMQQGVNGRRADVINNSWRWPLFDSAAVEPHPAVMLDALVAASHATFVCPTGNLGTPRPNTLTSPASCYNTLAVAALGGPNYDSVAGFSARGGSDFYNPATGQTIEGVRATVDLAAPGEMLLVASYNSRSPNPAAYGVGKGTSFASALVSGGAALLVDAGYDRFGGGAAVDGRVIQSVLQNAARPTVGWDNSTARDPDGVWRTGQSLDWAAGAGLMDLERSFHQYTAGTTDVPGTGGGAVRTVGWDFGRIGEDGAVEYVIESALAGPFRATLNWWADRSAVFKPVGLDFDLVSTQETRLVNLDLELWRVPEADGGLRQLVAASESLYNTTELLALSLEEPGEYLLRVRWAGMHYDLSGMSGDIDFAVAWWGSPSPEPATLGMLAGGALLLVRRRRRKSLA